MSATKIFRAVAITRYTVVWSGHSTVQPGTAYNRGRIEPPDWLRWDRTLRWPHSRAVYLILATQLARPPCKVTLCTVFWPPRDRLFAQPTSARQASRQRHIGDVDAYAYTHAITDKLLLYTSTLLSFVYICTRDSHRTPHRTRKRHERRWAAACTTPSPWPINARPRLFVQIARRATCIEHSESWIKTMAHSATHRWKTQVIGDRG